VSATSTAHVLMIEAANKLREAYEAEWTAGHHERARQINQLIIATYGVAIVVIDGEVVEPGAFPARAVVPIHVGALVTKDMIERRADQHDRSGHS
jgi:hypothetical protein